VGGNGFAADRDGDLWFTADEEIVRASPSGALVEYVQPNGRDHA